MKMYFQSNADGLAATVHGENGLASRSLRSGFGLPGATRDDEREATTPKGVAAS